MKKILAIISFLLVLSIILIGCSRCGDNPRPSSCIMYNSRIDITKDSVICEACKNDIAEHLNDHH